MIKALFRILGIDRAVFFSNANQITRLLTGPITIALVLRYLTPELQGYFYAFSGIVAMQTFLEMGFSQNILQFASHEYSKLRINSNSQLEGDPEALSRLSSLARLSFKYYACAAILFLIFIGGGGHIFFATSPNHGVAWQISWWIIALCAALSLMINPAWSLLDGCNQVAIISQFRFWQSLAGFASNAIALVCGFGIFVPAFNSAVILLVSLVYLAIRWKPFFLQLLNKPTHGTISWRHEIWPFQWRIAVSWMSGYFIFDIVNPIAFRYCGAVDAGRFGMSLQFAKMITNVGMAWIYTKAPRFGILVASKDWKGLDALWRHSATLATSMSALGLGLFLAAIPTVGAFIPKIPQRFAPLEVTAWIAGGMLVQTVIGAMALELRAHKREPYMWLSVGNAVLSIALIYPMTRQWGITGEAMAYTLAIWITLIPAAIIYYSKRIEYRVAVDPNLAPRQETDTQNALT
ncbi:MAG: lipopolysaccharide biosynthesis protein [Chthoniobacteraceae bacterium]